MWTDRRLRRRLLRVSLVGVVVVVAALLWRLIVAPVQDRPTSAAVIVVLAGTPDRLAGAERLLAERVASRLVIVADGRGGPAAGACSAPPAGVTVTCVEPAAPTLTAQAEAAGTALTSFPSGATAVVVTSRHQLTRARLEVGRCTTATIQAVATTPDDAQPGRWIDWLAGETPKLARALFRPACDPATAA